MRVRYFSGEDLRELINNASNPKTMDYYFDKILGLKLQSEDVGQLHYNGTFTASVRSRDYKVAPSFTLTQGRNRAEDSTGKRGNVYFVIELNRNVTLPKCRSLAIVRKMASGTKVINPAAGQQKQVVYSSGYVQTYIEPVTINIPVNLLLYRRNAWDRIHTLKTSDEPTPQQPQ